MMKKNAKMIIKKSRKILFFIYVEIFGLDLKYLWSTFIFFRRIFVSVYFITHSYNRKKFRSDLSARQYSSANNRQLIGIDEADRLSAELRENIRRFAGLDPQKKGQESTGDLIKEITILRENSEALKPIFTAIRSQRILYPGQSYYNSYYLSRALRAKGWRADVLDWDTNPDSKKFYHGHDFEFTYEEPNDVERDVNFFVDSIYRYDVFHFSNMGGLSFGSKAYWYEITFGKHAEIYLLKALGKKIVYSNNGCQDGVRKSSFAKWGPHSPCNDCIWKNNNQVCSDAKNASWGKFRNCVADFQCLLGGNRTDYNVSPKIHEVPEFYCLKPEIWDPDMDIPMEYRLPEKRPGEVRLYHAVGNADLRTSKNGVNIKSTHIHLPLIEKLRAKGHDLELISPKGVPNLDVRYLQLQSDIFLEMLTFGWFGANAREAMMLGKPVVCFIRPEWLDSVRSEIPEYADELPIVSALPETVEAVLEELIANPERRADIGRKSRRFALKWHSDTAAAERFDRVYKDLLMEKTDAPA